MSSLIQAASFILLFGVVRAQKSLRQQSSVSDVVCPERLDALDWWYETAPAYSNIKGANFTLEYKNLIEPDMPNRVQTIVTDEFQVWTSAVGGGDEIHSPSVTFHDPSLDGKLIQLNESFNVSFTVDLSDDPFTTGVMGVRLFTWERGTTQPANMAVTKASIVCF